MACREAGVVYSYARPLRGRYLRSAPRLAEFPVPARSFSFSPGRCARERGWSHALGQQEVRVLGSPPGPSPPPPGVPDLQVRRLGGTVGNGGMGKVVTPALWLMTAGHRRVCVGVHSNLALPHGVGALGEDT